MTPALNGAFKKIPMLQLKYPLETWRLFNALSGIMLDKTGNNFSVPFYLVLVPMDNDGPLWAPVLGRRHGRAGGGRLGTATGGGGLPPRAARRGAGTLQGGGCLPLCRGIWEIV
jgi:hypothetical protein